VTAVETAAGTAGDGRRAAREESGQPISPWAASSFVHGDRWRERSAQDVMKWSEVPGLEDLELAAGMASCVVGVVDVGHLVPPT
jgi:hypothetical protein